MTQRHTAGHRTQTIPRRQPQSVLKAHGRSWPWLGRSCQNFQGRTGTQIQKSLVLEKGKRLPMEQKSLAASHQARPNTKAPSLHHHASGPQVTLPTFSYLVQRDQSFGATAGFSWANISHCHLMTTFNQHFGFNKITTFV